MRYDGAEFLARVRAHWAAPERRTVPTGCWVCDVLLPSMVKSAAEVTGEPATGAQWLYGSTRRCAVVSGEVVDAHHLISRQQLKKEIRWRHDVVESVLMDPRIAILVRRYHHDLLESGAVAIPVALLPVDALEFADELGLRWWLENREAKRA